MKQLQLEEKYILEYIKEQLLSFKTEKKIIENAKFHHTTGYHNAVSIINNGILSLQHQKDLNINDHSKELLDIMNDTHSHINGSDGISLSVVGLDDLYEHEMEYNPFQEKFVDFMISNDIKAYRHTTHYGNEYISYDAILPDKFQAIDIRLLSYINTINNLKNKNPNHKEIIELMNKYNHLTEMALALQDNNISIPIREMSDNNMIELNKEQISESPKILIKK